MKPECEAAIEDALGRALRAGESRKIEDAVNLQMRLLARKDPEAWSALGSLDRLQQASVAAAAEMTRQAKLKQKRLQLQIEAHDRIENWLVDRLDKVPEKAKAGASLRAMSEMLAFDAKGKGMTSVETWSHAIANEALGRLTPLWEAQKGFMGLFGSGQGDAQIVRELFGESTGNAAAKAGADAWRQVTEELRDRANASGMDIGKLDEWRYPQNHSQGRVAQAGLEKWTEDTLPLLDRDKYIGLDGKRMTDDEVREFLRHAYDTIITDGMNKRELGSAGYGLSSRKGDAHRQIFFKDADAYLKYSGDYGSRNLWSTLTGHIRSISRDIGLNEVLGPNPEATFRYFNDRTKLDELRMEPTKAARINAAAKLNESLFDYVSGRREVVNQKIADIGQAFRNWETATKLGKVVITALGDEAGMAATAFANRIPWSQVFMREFKYLNPANSGDRAAVMHAGVGINSMIGNLNRFGYEDLQLGGGEGKAAGVRNFTSKLATTVMHASGAEAMWDARRRALGSVLMSAVGKLTREVPNFEDLNRTDHGVLADKGITKNDWEVWKLAEPEDWGTGAHGVITPKAIQAIPDEQLAHLGNPDAVRRHASTMLLGHILEETGMGVMDTGARERARNLLGAQAGSVMGELARAAMLFKSFSFSMMQKHWARASDMPTVGGSWQYAARLAVAGTVMGAVANQIRNMVAGKDPDNIAEPKFWGEAALRGGGLGFYGDFLYAEATQHDTNIVPALMGPLYTELESVGNLTIGNAFKASRGERTDEGAKVLRYVRGNIPFLNMWYTQAAMDHILWNEMQEAVSPGYLDRMQARAQKERGTTYFWDPHENLPSQGPDFAKMIRPDEGRRQFQAIADAVPFSGSTE